MCVRVKARASCMPTFQHCCCCSANHPCFPWVRAQEGRAQRVLVEEGVCCSNEEGLGVELLAVQGMQAQVWLRMR
jgi:hypothetical protein